MIKTISILGCTGSIGTQALQAAGHLGIKVCALAARRNIELLEKQARRFMPELVAVHDEAAALELKRRLSDTGIRVEAGMRGLREAAAAPQAEAVVTAVSGAVGLIPTLDAVKLGRRIALANKETLVCAGTYVMKAAARFGAEIIPVDSEHSAIFQCLAGRGKNELKKILLTGSGGPFRGWSRRQTETVTPEQAVRHPNWSMGAKISVDSATMMNKGLEFIEAMHLFGVGYDDISVVIHPQSVIHSMIELNDGAVIAQLGVPDMRLPIQYALTWPERMPSLAEPVELTALPGLTFEAPDLEKTPCLALAMQCAQTGGTAPAIMNAANEAAVGLFLNRRIGYNHIYECIASALESIDIISDPDLDSILAADTAARRYVQEVSKCI